MKLTRRDFVRTGVAGAAGLVALPEAFAQAPAIQNEDGYKLWLRFAPPPAAAADQYRRAIKQVLVEGSSATADVIRKEMTVALSAILGQTIPVIQSGAGIDEGTVVIGTPANSPAIRGISSAADLTKIGKEGFLIRPAVARNRSAIAVVADGEMGALYGAYHFLRL